MTLQTLVFDVDNQFARQYRGAFGRNFQYRQKNFRVRVNYDDGTAHFQSIFKGKAIGNYWVDVPRKMAYQVCEIFNADKRDL